MTDDELEALLADLEDGLREDVQAALTLTADEFADSVDAATELVAARFSVSRIRDMWKRRVPGIVDRLRRIAGRGAVTVVDDLDEDDVSVSAMDERLKPYLEATRELLDGVGDRLADAAVKALDEGTAAGDTVDELKARLIGVFADDGGQLGPGRAERIAMTEATRAFNAGALAAAQELTGPDRPLVKQWITRRDSRVREPHADANGQLQLLDDPFQVGGVDMQYPGDPTAPASLTVNCRCILRVATAERTASMTADSEELQSKMPPALKAYWLTGEGAAKIGWGTPGSFDRCVRNLRDDFPQDPEGLCANLYHEATGHWPGENRGKNADGTVHTGAMVALLPTDADVARLALDGGEAADQLHLTLFYLGDAADWNADARGQVISGMAYAARTLSPIAGRAFGTALWNPTSDEPAHVWNVGDDNDRSTSRLYDAKYEVQYALEDRHGGPDLPQQHSPWQPHICAAYGDADHQAMADRLGPVTFDRLVVAFGGQWTVIPLTAGQYQIGDRVHVTGAPHEDGHTSGTVEEISDGPAYGIRFDGTDEVHRWYVGDELAPGDMPPMPQEPMAELEPAPSVLTWSTPGNTALAFENQQTGDGRVFTPGALFWSGAGPWPLQFADEMQGGHDGARLAGAINTMGREGDRIPGAGVLYLTTSAGVEAAMLLSQGAPLGVSVDLDDVDLEMVDATDEGIQAYQAKLVTASLLPLPDGGWELTGETESEWFAASDSTAVVVETRKVRFLVQSDGLVPAGAFEIAAAAGDADRLDGVVVDSQRSGDYLMRITRARVRGATLVSIPAYADARIVLDDMSLFASAATVTAAAATSDYDRVVRHVRKAAGPVSPSEAAKFLKLTIVAVRRHLARAARKGDLVRVSRARYVGAESKEGKAVLEAAEAESATASATDATTVADELEELAASGTEVPEGEDMEASAWTAMQDLPPMPAAWFAEPSADELPPGGPGVNYAGGRIFGWVAQAGEPHAGFAKKVTIDGLGRIDTSHFLRQRFTLDDGSTVKAGAFTMNAGHHRDGAECETSACQFDDTRTVAGIVTVGMNDRGMWFSGAAAPWMSEWDRQVFMATQPSYHMKKGPSGNWQLRAVLSVPVPGHSSPLLASAVVERAQLALTAAATMADVEEAVDAENERQAAEQTASAADAVEPVAGAFTIDYDRLAEALVAATARAEQKKLDDAAELEALLAEGRTMDGDTGTEGN